MKIKSAESREVRSLFMTRSQLVKIRRDLGNQIRAMLKEHGQLFERSIGPMFWRKACDVPAGTVVAVISVNRPVARAVISVHTLRRTTRTST